MSNNFGSVVVLPLTAISVIFSKFPLKIAVVVDGVNPCGVEFSAVNNSVLSKVGIFISGRQFTSVMKVIMNIHFMLNEKYVFD